MTESVGKRLVLTFSVIIPVLVVAGCQASGQERGQVLPSKSAEKLSESGANSQDQNTKAIDAEVALINKSLRGFKKSSGFVEGISTEGVDATYYTDDKVPRKIHAEILGESFKSTVDLFYKNGHLIFSDNSSKFYSMPIDPDTGPEIRADENEKLYFKKGEFFTGRLTRRISPHDPWADSTESAKSIVSLDKSLRRGYK